MLPRDLQLWFLEPSLCRWGKAGPETCDLIWINRSDRLGNYVFNFSCWNPLSPESVALAQGVWRSSAAGWEAPVQEWKHSPGHNLDMCSRKLSTTCGFLTAWTFGGLSSPRFIWHSWWGGGNLAESGHLGNTFQWLWWVSKFLSVGQKLPLCGWGGISSLQGTSSTSCLGLGSAYDSVWIPARITSLRSGFLPPWCLSWAGWQAYLGWYRRRGSSMPAAVSRGSSWWTESSQTAERTRHSWEAESLRILRRVDGSGICKEPTLCIISQMSPGKAPLTRPPAVCP